jgi:N-acetylglucosaminyl-diphospho-decaprenol L-rhamnosyltransferase
MLDTLRTADAPDISVIVVNYNGARWLTGCLSALDADSTVSKEIILVDNASRDDSLEIARRHPGVRISAQPVNLGFAAGNNAGARLARGEWLAFLNNDTAPRSGWLAALRRVLERDPTAALAAACLVYLQDPSIVDSAGDGWTRWGGAFKRGHGQPAARFDRAAEVFGACGAAFMIPRRVFEELEGFDEDFFLAFEDVDLSYRARLLGYRCLYAPEAVVEHAGSATLGRLSAEAVFFGQRNLEWVYLKNTPWPLLLASAPGHAIYLLAAGVYFARCGRLRPFLRAKAAAIAGLWSVLRKRRRWQGRRHVPSAALWRVMERRSLRLKRREKEFDLSIATSR